MTVTTIKAPEGSEVRTKNDKVYAFDLDGVRVVVNNANVWTRAGQAKTRLYTECPDSEVREIFQGEFPGSASSDADWRRFNRAEIKVMRAHGDALIASLGLSSDIEYKFSRKAGCSCPCSPGFILDRKLWVRDAQGRDYIVESIHER